MISFENQFDSKTQILLKFIKSEKQEEACLAIAFDHQSQTMASGYGNKIRLWNFSFGQITEIGQLDGHNNLITCLLFSQKNRDIISASKDSQLRLWKENSNSQWISTQAFQEHFGGINCCIMNSFEDLLITGSEDKQIKVWNIDLQKNYLKVFYNLNKHSSQVIGLTLTPNQDVLASCGLDNQIIIWEKKQNVFQFRYVIIVKMIIIKNKIKQFIISTFINNKQSVIESGCRLCFINNNKLIWVSRSNEKMHVFEVQDSIFRENTQLKLELERSPKCLEQFFFPVVNVKKSSIIVLKNRFYLYFINEQLDGHFEILKSIDLFSTATFGSLSQDGRYLVFWDDLQNSYSIYEITLQ